VRLFKELEARNRDLTEALDQQTATSEILRVISGSTTDVQPVFGAIVQSATRLCDAAFGGAFRFDGQLVTLAGHYNATSVELDIWRRRYPTPATRGHATGRAIVDRRIIHIPDIREDPEYTSPTRQQLGWRTVLAVPMLRDGEPIGAFGLWRREVRPFTEKQIELVSTFADQAVIAIENVLHAVLSTIVARATELSGTDAGVVYEYDEQREVFLPRATEHLETEIVETMLATPVRKEERATGRLAEVREPIQLPDILAAPAESRVRGVLVRAGYRALLAVPLVREDHLIGGLTVIRKSTGDFTPEVIGLLRTFATQSALAIQNARLFREIEEKSRELEAASRHKSDTPEPPVQRAEVHAGGRTDRRAGRSARRSGGKSP
jgi:GAF domain-containing protein